MKAKIKSWDEIKNIEGVYIDEYGALNKDGGVGYMPEMNKLSNMIIELENCSGYYQALNYEFGFNDWMFEVI